MQTSSILSRNILGVYENCISRANINCSVLMVALIKYAIALGEGCHRNVRKAYANCLALCAKKSLSHNYRGGRDLASKVTIGVPVGVTR